MTTIGSLFSGYSGLDMAVETVTGGRTIWRSDIDPGANKIIAHHWPADQNLGDISAVDWDSVEPVDVITGGFPCTDVSMAGRRAGLIRSGEDATRSGLWGMMATAIDHLRPSLVVIENVRGLLSAAADSDVEPCPWCMGDADGEPPLRALWPQSGDTDSSDRNWRTTAGLTRQTGSQAGPAADTNEIGWGRRPGIVGPRRWGQPTDSGDLPTDADRAGLAQRPSITRDDGIVSERPTQGARERRRRSAS